MLSFEFLLWLSAILKLDFLKSPGKSGSARPPHSMKLGNTCLPASMLSSSSISTFRFFQLRKYSPNSRCCPPSCLLAVFAMFVAIISPSSSCSSYSWNEWSVCYFCFHNQNNSTSSPGPLSNGALTCSWLHFWRHFLVKYKILPNLVISNWLWWIMCVLLLGKYFEWIII